MIDILTPDFEFEDSRGMLKQLVHGEIAQVNFVESLPDSVRGGHYHKLNKESFYVIEGSFDVILRLGAEEKTYSFSEGALFSIDANVVHSFLYKEKTRLIVMYDRGVELPDGTKDIYPE